jgi:hypothetical protein
MSLGWPCKGPVLLDYEKHTKSVRVWYLTWLILRPWIWRRHVPPKRRLTFKRIVRHNIPEGRTLHNRRCVKLKILQLRKCTHGRTIRGRSIPFSLIAHKMCFVFSTAFARIASRSGKYLASNARGGPQTFLGLRVKCPLLLPDFGRNCNVSKNFIETACIKFHGNPLDASPLVARRRTSRCEHAKKDWETALSM